MRQGKVAETAEVSELEIVDICTRLIFGTEDELSLREQMIIAALRLSDDNFGGDNTVEMGKYLRALGVREMIKLVAVAKHHMDVGHVLSYEYILGRNLYIN